MTAVIEQETELSFLFDHEALFKEIVSAVIEKEACPYEVSVTLFITDGDGIRELNREHRGLDAVTDVLSFPLISWSKPSFFEDLEKDPDNFDPDTGELLLGDIVLCLDRAMEQAESYGHSLKREYAFLITHSLLHLLGYDHMEDKERELMEERQEDILSLLAIPRDRDEEQGK